MPEQYVNFDLHIGPDGYTRSNSEQGQRTAILPIAVPEDIRLTLQLIETGYTSEELLKEFGKKLYKTIFPPNIDMHFNQTEAVARSQQQKIRTRLTIEPDTLATLPWEFLYREERGYFLAVNPDTVLSHYLDLPMPSELSGKQKKPFHLLIIIAAPTDQSPLDPEEWERIILQALHVPLEQQLLTVTVVKHATYEQIRNALLPKQPHIIQFVGHGIYSDGKGYLALVDGKTNKTWEVDDTSFANIFLGSSDKLRLVSLATCESAKSESPRSFLGIAPQIVQRGVPAVVAMQYPVLISTAEIYLDNFYTAVAARKPIDWAVQDARKAIAIKKGADNREFANPVLYMRTKDGNIFGE